MLRLPFSECVAAVLNRLLNTHLTGWDIGFYCGRTPVHLRVLTNKVIAAEAWHTSSGTFDRVARGIAGRICDGSDTVSDWLNIAVRAAVWFGIFADLKRSGIHRADVSVVGGDFTVPISAWYARHWGLPMGKIVCCCNENNAVWELLCHGQMRTDMLSVPTMITEADVAVPAALERLIYEAGGPCETAAYLDACRQGLPYHPGDGILSRLRVGMYSVVVSSRRLESTVPGVFRSHGYLMAPGTALAYAGLQDYRARTGQTDPCIIWAEENPMAKSDALSALLGISREEIENV